MNRVRGIRCVDCGRYSSGHCVARMLRIYVAVKRWRSFLLLLLNASRYSFFSFFKFLFFSFYLKMLKKQRCLVFFIAVSRWMDGFVRFFVFRVVIVVPCIICGLCCRWWVLDIRGHGLLLISFFAEYFSPFNTIPLTHGITQILALLGGRPLATIEACLFFLFLGPHHLKGFILIVVLPRQNRFLIKLEMQTDVYNPEA